MPTTPLPLTDAPRTPPDGDHVRVAVVGSGFAGLAMGVALRRRGITDFTILERADGVGGTWRDNTYPGCACDVPSHLYSLSFAPNKHWTRSFSTQPEIRAYVERVYDERDIRRHVRLGHEVRHSTWDDAARRWVIDTNRGTLTADVLVLGSGGLSDPRIPDLPGLGGFTGEVFHSARWPRDLDLTGRRVAVVGTGASAIQFVPAIAGQVERLHLFQRTPPWVLPRLDRRLPAVERAVYRHVPGAERLARLGVFTLRELGVPAFVWQPRLGDAVKLVAKAHLRRQVRDARLRRALTPDYDVGCKRILLSNTYFPALTRPNVEVIDSGLARLTPRGAVSADGRAREVDTVIFGTGFQIGDLPMAHRVTGRGGRLLADRWRAEGMTGLRGTAVSGFPNLFVLVGPNTGVGHTSIIYQIESQVRYVADALRVMAERGLDVVDPRPEVQSTWNDRLHARLDRTVWNTGGCASWYLDDAGRNPTLWPGSVLQFRAALRRFDVGEYAVGRRRAAPAAEPVAEPVAAAAGARP